jgi:hypothetical protein
MGEVEKKKAVLAFEVFPLQHTRSNYPTATATTWDKEL